LLACAGTISESIRIENLRRQFAASQVDNAGLRARLADTDADLQTALKALRDDLTDIKEETTDDLVRAQRAATRHTDTVADRLATLEQERRQQLTNEIGEIRESAEQASSRLEKMSSVVGLVRTDIDSAKDEIAGTRSDLQRARGDMGMMSGAIATNAREIRTLREMGDRNIYEFTLKKSAGSQRVGDIQVALRKSDPKHSRFTIEVVADDKRVEKRDRTVNEPVQFYTSRARQPYELVVNEVGAGKITGYLAAPKSAVLRASGGGD
jgi:chromosome segregation ATPase